ncbi:MAG: hypothetical protein U9N52_04740, partial [Campylobacterota bacterium]|nr:hypothetical protein [Campylobacterota bacterium]
KEDQIIATSGIKGFNKNKIFSASELVDKNILSLTTTKHGSGVEYSPLFPNNLTNQRSGNFNKLCTLRLCTPTL